MSSATAQDWTAAAAAIDRSRQKGRRLMLILGMAAAIVSVIAMGVGAMALSPGQVVAVLADTIGIELPWAFDATEASVVLDIRAPRVLMGLIVGAGLALSGAVLQGLFRNPLADPGLIGVASGARLGAAISIVLTATPVLSWAQDLDLVSVPLFAFAGALGAMALVYRMALKNGRVEVTTMLLAGVAVAFFAEAAVGLLSYVADDVQLRTLTIWRLGSLGGASWDVLAVTAGLTAVSCSWLLRDARALNAFLLGEAEAGHLGIATERVKIRIVVLSAIAVAAAVAFVGVISFVGLAIPHLVRLLAGPDHRIVLPGSVLLGAVGVVLADLTARTLAAPAELPVGSITAFAGAPFFAFLLIRSRSHHA